ncbi:MAG TPA: hypothetical protein VGO61_05370 [Steroidobacteraceae bacterium]|jgi:hypothetical protein|nr:hypothetical protein [Steroidobacteraceae bacterium]
MKASVLGLAIATAAFGGSTVYLALQLQEERAQADKVAEAMQGLNARIAELQKSRTERRFADAARFGGTAKAPGVRPMGSSSDSTEKADGKPQVTDSFAMNGPPRSEAFRKMMRTQMRVNNKRLYVDVGAKLGLSQQEANKLIDLLTDQQVESFAIGRDAGDPTERRRLLDELRRDDQAEITDLLGATKAESLKDYQESIPARQELEMLSRQLEGADATLSADQQKRMLAMLVDERKRIPMPAMSESSTPEEYTKASTEWQADYNERVASQARTILSSEQLTAYNDYQQWQTEMREQMAVRRANRGQRGPGGPDVMFAVATPVGEVTTTPAPAQKPRKAQ